MARLAVSDGQNVVRAFVGNADPYKSLTFLNNAQGNVFNLLRLEAWFTGKTNNYGKNVES